MDDLIKRSDAIEYFMTNTNWHDEDGYMIEDAEEKRRLLTDYFDGIPSAQTEGEWIYCENEFGIDGYMCSECRLHIPWDYEHKFIGFIEDYRYCPACGTRMRVAKETDDEQHR